jgi:hypothetical protein
MSFHELNARFRRLHKEHAAWRLLRMDNPNAPALLGLGLKKIDDLLGGCPRTD